MKRVSIILLLAASGLFVACRTQEPVDSSDRMIRFISHDADVVSRTTVVASGTKISMSWKDSDKVGIFAKGTYSGNNYAYLAAPDLGNEINCSFSPVEDNRFFPYSKEVVTYYAYSPFSENVGDADPENVAISVPKEQVQSQAGNPSDLASLFFMKATPVSAVGEEVVELVFKGVLSIVEIRLKTQSGEVPVQKARLVSDTAVLTFEGTEDITESDAKTTVIAGFNDATVLLRKSCLVKTAIQKLFFVVKPGHHPAGTLKLEVTSTGNKTVSYVLPAVTFEPNRNYMQTVVIDPLDY